jgi:hypothetical protein
MCEMRGYLGESVILQESVPQYAGFTAVDWSLTFISQFGGIDGAHHKMWVLDQVARILLDTPVILSVARWEDGTEEYRFRTGNSSDAYSAWVISQRGEQDHDTGEFEYDWDEGIAP